MSDETPLLMPAAGADGRDFLAMVVRRSYRVHGSRLSPMNPPPDAVLDGSGDEPESTASERRAALAMDHFAPLKPATDVVLCGTAHPRGRSVRMLDTAVGIGRLRKHVRAWGERTIQLDPSGRLRFTEPEPMEPVPLVWERAYGGRDRFAEARQPASELASAGLGEAVSYPRNRLGRGFGLDIERGRFSGQPAPNLEDPEDPVTPDRLLAQSAFDWIRRPTAACYEPIGAFQFPRIAFFLAPLFEPPGADVFEVRKGALGPGDLTARRALAVPDARFRCCAPVGLSGARLLGNERVSLWNLHPTHALFELDLPADRPRMLLEPPGCRIHDLPPVLQTVLIEPDEERVTLTWSGVLEVAAPFSEEACQTMRRAVRWLR